MNQKAKNEDIRDAKTSLEHYKTSYRNLALDYTFRQNVFHFEQRAAILSVLGQVMNAFQVSAKKFVLLKHHDIFEK